MRGGGVSIWAILGVYLCSLQCEFTSAAERLEGPAGVPQHQGFCVFRENNLPGTKSCSRAASRGAAGRGAARDEHHCGSAGPLVPVDGAGTQDPRPGAGDPPGQAGPGNQLGLLLSFPEHPCSLNPMDTASGFQTSCCHRTRSRFLLPRVRGGSCCRCY